MVAGMSRHPLSIFVRAFLAAALALALACLPSMAAVASAVTLQAKLQPKTLGASTTVSIGFQIAASTAQQLSPLSGFEVSLPAGMGFAATTLGLGTCSAQTLLSEGVGACPRDSAMGYGSAQVQVPFGAQIVRERARVSIFMTHPVDGRTTMLFYFDGRAPVIAPLVLQSEVLTPENSLDSVLSTTIPSIPTAPESADVAIVALQVSIGPSHVWYFKRVHGRTVAYRPTGLNVPETCPRGGFAFSAELRFQDGSALAAKSVVACPPRRRKLGDRRA